jgi:hypothetical protein
LASAWRGLAEVEGDEFRRDQNVSRH